MYKIYISGAIGNNNNYIKNFTDAKQKLEALGFEVLSPLDTQAHKNKLPVKFCMFEAIDLLKQADFFTIITFGIKSKGSNIERDLALYCGIPYLNYLELGGQNVKEKGK